MTSRTLIPLRGGSWSVNSGPVKKLSYLVVNRGNMTMDKYGQIQGKIIRTIVSQGFFVGARCVIGYEQ